MDLLCMPLRINQVEDTPGLLLLLFCLKNQGKAKSHLDLYQLCFEFRFDRQNHS